MDNRLADIVLCAMTKCRQNRENYPSEFIASEIIKDGYVKPPLNIDDVVFYVREYCAGDEKVKKVESAYVIMISQKKDKTWKIRISFGNGGSRYNTKEIHEKNIGVTLFKSFEEANKAVKKGE